MTQTMQSRTDRLSAAMDKMMQLTDEQTDIFLQRITAYLDGIHYAQVRQPKPQADAKLDRAPKAETKTA